LLGETGVGKGVLSRWMHANGPRAHTAFVDINCAGLTPEFLESELFGYARGAFTGAVTAKAGLLEVGQDGTVFLDEVGDMPLGVQAKLLKVVEERAFRRMGDVVERATRARFILATHRDLPALVAQGRFRSDLYYRVSGLSVRVPPLRARADDIPALAQAIFVRAAALLDRPPPALSDSALAVLMAHSWPGNIRELRNVLERAVLLSDGGTLAPADLDVRSEAPSAPATTQRALGDAEREIIRSALAAEGGHVQRAARRLGIPRSTLYEKIRRYRLGEAP
jgi:DNA-binding NtrC family response regulator